MHLCPKNTQERTWDSNISGKVLFRFHWCLHSIETSNFLTLSFPHETAIRITWTSSVYIDPVVQKSTRIFMYMCTNTKMHGLILCGVFFDHSIRPKALSAPGHVLGQIFISDATPWLWCNRVFVSELCWYDTNVFKTFDISKKGCGHVYSLCRRPYFRENWNLGRSWQDWFWVVQCWVELGLNNLNLILSRSAVTSVFPTESISWMAETQRIQWTRQVVGTRLVTSDSRNCTGPLPTDARPTR